MRSDLGFTEQRKMADKLINAIEDDNEKFLWKLKHRLDRVGIDVPEIEVRFEHLRIKAEAHVGNTALPTVFNFTINVVENDIAFGASKLWEDNIAGGISRKTR
ncbi:transcription factor [Dionaea muscipula]